MLTATQAKNGRLDIFTLFSVAGIQTRKTCLMSYAKQRSFPIRICARDISRCPDFTVSTRMKQAALVRVTSDALSAQLAGRCS